MIALSSYLALSLYLVPVVVLLLARARRDMDAAEAAALVPTAVAADLLVTLLFTHAFTLQTSVILVRVLWVLGGAAFLVTRWRRSKALPGLPVWLDVWTVGAVLCAAYVATKLSMDMSRECHNAARGWHTPLIPPPGGQPLPSRSVSEPQHPLAYHYTGDVLGVMMPTLPGMRLHAPLALTLARDVMYGLVGVTMALFTRSLGFRGITIAVLAGLGVLLSGPMTVVTHEPKLVSYSYVNFYRLSFRPHVPLAALLVSGIIGTVIARVRGVGPVKPLSLGVAIMVGAMAITDEATIALLGLSLGCAWLVYPKILGEEWWHGVLWLGALLFAVTVPQIIFSGSLSSHAPKHVMELVPPRAPGYLRTPLALAAADGRGKWSIIYDVMPQFAVLAAVAWVVVRHRTRAALALLAFGATSFFAAYWLLTRVEIDKMPIENHRFWTAPMLAMPILGLYVAREAKDAFPKFLVVLAVGASALSSLAWVENPQSRKSFCTQPSRYKSPYDFYKVDCLKHAGASLGGSTVPTYLEAEAAYLYAGCHPTFTAGPTHRVWKNTAIGAASSGLAALRDLHDNMVAKDAPLDVVCLQKRRSKDPVCEAARRVGACSPPGREVERCSLPADKRTELLRGASPPPVQPADGDDRDNDGDEPPG